MNILRRSLQFHRARATHIVSYLLSHNTAQSLVASSAFSSLTGTRWPFKVFARDVKDTSCGFTCLNSRCHYSHVTPACSLDQNVNNDNSSEKLTTVANVKPRHQTDSTAATSDISSVEDQLSLSKDVLKLDVDSKKTESHIRVDESKREVVVYVDNAFMKTKAIDLYKIIRKMDSEQVLSLVEQSHQVLDKTHLALCMKRLFTLSVRDPQHCDVDMVRQDQRFQILCAYVAKKARYLQPAILNDIVTFLCHFGVTSSHPVMRVCLQLMMKQINSLALDQLTMLAHDLSGMAATKQTRVLREAMAILCDTRGDQMSLLSVEHKIYLLEEFGCRLQYTNQLLESLWDDKRDLRKWQHAVGFFIALAKSAAPAVGDDGKRALERHESLEEWCMDILLQQYVWLSVDDIEALVGAFIQLGIYDGELLRKLGDHIEHQSSELTSRLSVWNLLADADYMHIGLMEALLTDLRDSDVRQMSVDTQLSLVAFLAEAVNYYCHHNTDREQLSDLCFGDTIAMCVEELRKTLHTSENVPPDLQLETCLYWTALQGAAPASLSSHVLDTYTAQMSATSLPDGQSQVYPTLLDKVTLLAALQSSSNTVDARVSEMIGLVREQSRPRSALRPALLMACDNVSHGHTTSLGFYADHLLPSRTPHRQSTAVLCWYYSHHFWINIRRLKCIPHLYAATLHRLHSYNVLVVNASAWLSLTERERFMYISAALNKELEGLTVI